FGVLSVGGVVVGVGFSFRLQEKDPSTNPFALSVFQGFFQTLRTLRSADLHLYSTTATLASPVGIPLEE
ncbi:hypothetical protein, partial [Dermatophilus congolensis]|uniref:hypothetical protein n=1 Tax=Dermatophilus congolensis TaxID=1863 RepID=UPI001AB047FE